MRHDEMEDRLYRIDRMTRAAGMAPLSREELQRLAQQMQAPGRGDSSIDPNARSFAPDARDAQ